MWSIFIIELVLIPVVWLCYDNLLFLIPAQVIVPLGVKKLKAYRKERRKDACRQGFSELLTSFMTSVQAGLSMENACFQACDELVSIHHETNDPLVSELKILVKKLKLGVPVAKAFRELADEIEIEEIEEFSTVLEIVSVTGGNTVEILKNSLDHLRDKMDTNAQIRLMMTGKLFEKNIMLAMPFVIIIYLRLTNPDYMSCYYESLAGRVVMTIVLAVIAGGYYWAERIMKIEI